MRHPIPPPQLQGVFGRAFSVIARFRPAATEILAPALANEPDLDGGSDATVEGWLAGLARVREPIAAWRRLILYQRAFARCTGTAPHRAAPAGDRSGDCALGGAAFRRPPQRDRARALSRSRWTAQPSRRPSDAWSGLLLDAWPELLPNVEEDAGMVFHYDAPGAQAPQAVLLAVPPPGAKTWSYELLEQTLFHTLDLVRMRATDLA